MSDELPFSSLNDEEFYLEVTSYVVYMLHLNDFSLKYPRDTDDDVDELPDTCQYHVSSSFTDSFGSSKNKFSLFHLNSRSLCNKFSNIQDFLLSLKFEFSIIGFTETWYKEQMPSIYNMPNYCLISNNRTHRRGGGVCLYVNNQFDYIVKNDLTLNNTCMQSLFIEILNGKEKNIVIGIIYRAPNSNFSDFISHMERMLLKLKVLDLPCYIMGDFNIDLLKYVSNENPRLWLSNMMSFGYQPLITKPTRVTKFTHTCIDNIFTNIKDRSFQSGIFFTDLSDHLPIFSVTNSKFKTKIFNVPSGYRDFSKSNTDCLKTLLKNTDWSVILQCTTPNHANESFIDLFKRMYDQCLPKQKKKSSMKPRKPWTSNGILISIAKKQSLFKTFLENPTAFNERQYKQYRNRVTQIIRNAKKAYYCTKFKKLERDIKSTWKTINEVLGKSNTSKQPNHIITTDNKKINNNEQISNQFNIFE